MRADARPSTPPYVTPTHRRAFSWATGAASGTVLGLARQLRLSVALGRQGDYTYVLDRAAPAVHRIRSNFALR